MTPSERSYSVEGELVHEWWEYEVDDVLIDGQRLQDLLTESGLYFTEEVLDRYNGSPIHTLERFGRVRLTVEVIG